MDGGGSDTPPGRRVPLEALEGRLELAFSHLWSGAVEEAEVGFRAGVAEPVRLGERGSQAMGLTYLAVTFRTLGQLEAPRVCATEALAVSEEVQHWMYIGAARANLAWVALQEGDSGKAKVHAEAALEHWGGTGRYPFTWPATEVLEEVKRRA